MLAEHGISSEICDIPTGLARLSDETFDLVTINGLAFSMTQAEKYAPLRDEWAFSIDADVQAALHDHVLQGRGVLGIHTAAICFDTWPVWGDLLGVRWVWGQSGHPAPADLHVSHDGAEFDIFDELYTGLALHPDTKVQATAHLRSGGPSEPVLTAKGNAAYLALGHDLRSVRAPGFERLLAQAIKTTRERDNHANG